MSDRGNGERFLAYLVGGAFVVAGLVRNARMRRVPRTAEEEARLAEQRAQDWARHEQRDLEHKQRTTARSRGLAYFGGDAEGRRLLDAATVTTFPVGSTYPDAVVDRSRTQVTSAEAGARLTLNLDFRDGMGTVRLSMGGRPSFEQTFGHHPYEDSDHLHLVGDDLAMFAVMARLLGSLGRGFAGIRVRRTDWEEAREELWSEHLARNPRLAREIGWTGDWPYTYL